MTRTLPRYAVLAACLCCSPRALAGELRNKDDGARVTFDYGLGLSVLQVRDDLLRPLRWTGGIADLALGLDVETAKWRHEGDLALGLGLLWNRYGHQGAMFTQGIHYAVARRLLASHTVAIFAGAAYRYESLDAYYFDWDDSFLYWFTTHTLAPRVAFEMRSAPATRLRAAIELPLIGLLSRPELDHPYKVDPLPYFERWPALTNRGLRWVGPTDLFAPTLTMRMDHALGRHFGFRAGLEVTYRRAIEPRGYYAFAERLFVELRHAF